MIPSTRFCDRCGATNRSQSKFCVVCGSLLQQDDNQQNIAKKANTNLTGLLATDHLLGQRYRIVKPLGKGGMATVYKVEDIRFGNAPRAIKEMSQSGLNAQDLQVAIQSFEQEALLLSRLMHQNLPRIYDQFAEQGRWYLVMDYIEGETLETRLEHSPKGRLTVEEARPIALQLCSVLDYLHTQQPAIIFRDLKPSNVMITRDDHIYLIDFGIARVFKLGKTQDTTLLGSPGYAPPEQYGRAQTTPSADIFSLGVLLHQMLSGIDPTLEPFQFAPLDLGDQAGYKDFAQLIMRMVSMKKDQRPASAASVKQEIQRIFTPKPMINSGNMLPQPMPRPIPPSPLPPATSSPTPVKGVSFKDVVRTGLAITKAVLQSASEAEKAARNYRPSVREIISPEKLHQLSSRPSSALGSIFTGHDQEELKNAKVLRSEKKVERMFRKSYADVVLAVFLVLENRNTSIVKIGDTLQGAYIRAVQPPTVWTNPAHLFFEIIEENSNSVVVSGTFLVQQLYDWGKGERILKEILAQVAQQLS